MSKMTKEEIQVNRQMANDVAAEHGKPAPIGNVVHITTVTRAVRGVLLGSTADMYLVADPAIIWNAGAAYFTSAAAEKSIEEEPSGAPLVIVMKGGTVAAWDFGPPKAKGRNVKAKAGATLPDVSKLVNSFGEPLLGRRVHLSSATFEWHGDVEYVDSEQISLAKGCRITNDIESGHFNDFFHARERGRDDFECSPCSVMWGALTMVFVR